MLKNFKPVSLILCAGALCFSGSMYANIAPVEQGASISQQNGKVTGTVEDDFGPVTGASVVVKGTTNGTITDMDGNFTLEGVKNGDVIQISFIGYSTMEITYTGQPVGVIKLAEDTQKLDEVVVTALGMKRSEKSLGYAMQELKGDALLDSRESNIANALSGKVSGLQVVRSSGSVGGSSKIVLRGANSLTGSNQPLVVVDGTPMDNFTGGVDDAWGNSGTDMGNGLSDINPEDIESMSVLKGASAAALYGSRAGNGVILITTKSGKKNDGLGINVNFGVTADTPFMLPELQSSFGQGSVGAYNDQTNLSWGPRIEGQTITTYDGRQVPMAAYDNIGAFFGTGTSFNEGVSFQQDVNGTSMFFSFNRQDDSGVTPEQSLNKTNLTLRATSFLDEAKKWKVDAKVNYVNQNAHNRPIIGINPSNAFSTVYNLPRSLNVLDFENCVDDQGKMVWYDKSNSPQENPYWVTQYRQNDDTRNRILGNASLKYAPTDWFDIELRGGTDYYTTTTTQKLYSGGNTKPEGSYSEGSETFYENNFSFLATARKDDLISKLGGFVTFGGNIMQQKRTKMNASAGTLLVPDLFDVNNGVDKPSITSSLTQRKMNSLYGSLQLNWDGWLFLDVTARNDWSSTMSKENRSYFYPSVSLSAVISDMVQKNGGSMPDWFSFAKVRASFAEVGNDLDPYQLYNVYTISKDANGNSMASAGSTLFDSSVKSELIKSWEVGADLRFFNNRFGIDAAWYKTNATNQLLNIPMDAFSGYESRKVNAGNIQNQGFELSLNGAIMQTASG
ncbi:SusC/RagA family TonB-linked outer membrane protein, partial [Parabacteroides distasonis]